jgi:hypothetical protein
MLKVELLGINHFLIVAKVSKSRAVESIEHCIHYTAVLNGVTRERYPAVMGNMPANESTPSYAGPPTDVWHGLHTHT